MEDRVGEELYLEMSALAPPRFASERVPRLTALPGVSRVSWWANACPGRTDLPRLVPEFQTLGVAECDGSFVAPAGEPGVTAIHYRRFPRPAQGTLSGLPTLGLLLVLISPRRPEEASALRDWADFVHIRHIAATANPGFTMITPYGNATGDHPLFCHLYEMDTGEPEKAFRAMTPRVAERLGGGPGHPDFDRWATHEALRIHYVNTFARAGEALGELVS